MMKLLLDSLRGSRRSKTNAKGRDGQNKGVVDPKVQATNADAKGKGLLLGEEDMKPHQPLTSQMLINKLQHQQEKASEREEWARHNEGHWRCPFFKYYW
jgi:hypothetical protein